MTPALALKVVVGTDIGGQGLGFDRGPTRAYVLPGFFGTAFGVWRRAVAANLRTSEQDSGQPEADIAVLQVGRWTRAARRSEILRIVVPGATADDTANRYSVL